MYTYHIMIFWKRFFTESSNLHIKYLYNTQSDQLLIQRLPYKNTITNIYFNTSKQVSLIELEKLCDSVGWVRRPVSKVKLAIQNSMLVITLFWKSKHYKYLIGFARVTSDCAFNATIWDVVIHPHFQGHGLGSALMHQLIKKLRTYNINTITLFADPQVVLFYQKLGFTNEPDGVKGMFWYPQ